MSTLSVMLVSPMLRPTRTQMAASATTAATPPIVHFIQRFIVPTPFVGPGLSSLRTGSVSDSPHNRGCDAPSPYRAPRHGRLLRVGGTPSLPAAQGIAGGDRRGAATRGRDGAR